MKKAIVQKRKIKFIYYNKVGQTSLRVVNPIKIVYDKNNEWALTGLCNDNNQVKKFVFKNITQLNILPDKFIEKANEDELKNDDIIEVHLRFSKRIAYKMYDEFKNNEIVRNNDGSILLDIYFCIFVYLSKVFNASSLL